MLRPLVALLLVCALSGRACAGRRLLQGGDTTFPLFGDDAKLTDAQAAKLAGLWRMDSPKDQRRLDGAIYDEALLSAVKAGDADFEQVLTDALEQSSSLSNYALLIPAVDAQSGLFVAYRLMRNVSSAAPGAALSGYTFQDVKRIAGLAAPLPDGGLTWRGTDNVDTALYAGLVPAGGDTMEVVREEGSEVWSSDGTRTVDDQSTVQIKLEKVGDAQEVDKVAGEVAAALPLASVREGKGFDD